MEIVAPEGGSVKFKSFQFSLNVLKKSIKRTAICGFLFYQIVVLL